MATKITITVEDEELREIRALVAAGQAANTSAFVKHAIGIALADGAERRQMLKEALQPTGGPLTKKERDWPMRFWQHRSGEAGGTVRRRERLGSMPVR
ncbi:MAG: hypothetical protein JNL98_01305 [Bryobacterales bacterium]|nr:hypothetical protein [Bryobacterales bacterium]